MSAGTPGGSPLEPLRSRSTCEHTAILLQSERELPSVLASFYQLGVSRNGWLVHGSLPGKADTDRARMAAAGIDVQRLEEDERMAVMELDLTQSPEEWVKPWARLLNEKLRAGFSALWFARFPIGPTQDELRDVLPFEAAWMESFRGQRVVTLCPYIVDKLSGDQRSTYISRVEAVHEQVIQAA